MTESSEHRSWRRVFYPTDFSRGAHTAFSHALRLAISLDAELEIAHVSARGRSGFGSLPGVRDTLSAWQAAQGECLPASRIKVRKTTISGEKVDSSILGYLEKHPAEVVVLTTHKRKGWDRLRQGGTAIRIARQAKRVGLILPRSGAGFVDKNRGMLRLEQILVPVDHLPSPQQTVDRLERFLALIGQVSPFCTLLHICDVGQNPPDVRMPSSSVSTRWQYDIRSGAPEEVIVTTARQQKADLLVVASEGRTDLGDVWHGSMAERILRQVQIPILLLPRSRS